MRVRKNHGGESMELNVTAMLDMAFQLLTFFILTFRPAPVEGQLLLRMPPPQPVTKTQGASAGNNANNTDVMKGLDTLIITAVSNGTGSLEQMRVGETAVGTLPALERKLQAVLGDGGAGFEQVIVMVDSRLRYEDLMQVIDVCTRQKLANGESLTKLSFVELPAG